MGTLEKKAWREGMKEPLAVADMEPHTHNFKTYYQELRSTRPGWYGPDQGAVAVAGGHKNRFSVAKADAHLGWVVPRWACLHPR